MAKRKSEKSGASGAAPDVSSWLDGLASEDLAKREKARENVLSLRDKAVPILVEALADRRQQVRWEAAKALGQINSPVAAPSLVKALTDKDHDVRWLAAEALIALGSAAAGPILEALIKDPESLALRENAHHILNHLAAGDAHVEHHITGHPRGGAPLKEVLSPVVAALDGATPQVEAPLAAQKALDLLFGRG